MMTRLMKRGEELAAIARQRRAEEVAQHLRGLLGEGAVAVEEARVLVRGKGMIKRWLIDPQLRFLK